MIDYDKIEKMIDEILKNVTKEELDDFVERLRIEEQQEEKENKG